jgi:hypothetical protein
LQKYCFLFQYNHSKVYRGLISNYCYININKINTGREKKGREKRGEKEGKGGKRREKGGKGGKRRATYSKFSKMRLLFGGKVFITHSGLVTLYRLYKHWMCCTVGTYIS